MGSFNFEKGFRGAQFSSSKLGLKEEFGTCNACAPSCSPCVHFEQMASMATKTNQFSSESCQEKDSNRCFSSDADLSSSRVNSKCNDKRHTSSETSHPVSACLTRESSESAESRETLRDCNVSEDVKMIIKPYLRQTCASNCGSIKAPIFHYEVVSNQLEKQKELECLGDNISLICGSDHAKTRASGHIYDGDKKHSCTFASVNCFSEAEKAVDGQPASCFLAGSHCEEVDDHEPKRPNRSFDESSPEIFCCSNKSDISEISSLRDSCAGASSAKGERSECSEEQVQSSFARAGALQVSSQIGEEHNSAESMQVDTGGNGRDKTADVKSTSVVKEVNMVETATESRPAVCCDGPDSIEYEVKVCDICGDIGREELLAVCSKCNDGAEHIYCMCVKMDNVPKGDWMCEECMLSEENKKQKQDKLEEGVRTLTRSYTSESKTQGLDIEESKTYRVGSNLKTKVLDIEEHKTNKVSSTPFFTSKRPAGGLQSVRKRPFGSVLKSPSSSSSSSKTMMHHSGGQSSSTSMNTVRLPTESSSKSPKLSLQSPVSRGFLSKSKSFSSINLKEDVRLLKEGSWRNEGFDKETASGEGRGRVKMMSRSMSLKNKRSYDVNDSNHDVKLLPNISRGEDLKRSSLAKGHHSTKTENKLRSANCDLYAADKRIASPSKNSSPHSSPSSFNNLTTEKGHEISDNSVKISGHSAQGGSAKEEKKRAVDVRQHVECSTEGVPSIGEKHLNPNVHSEERPCLRDSSMFASEVQMPSWISAVPHRDYTWRGNFEIQRSRGLSFTCYGMQAHLSTYASHKVLEEVQKLPQKLLLEEAPRLSMWPTQFMKSHATEDDIALYFFAKDLDSYEGSYKNMLDRMIENDFGLKGNIGGVELLMFSSNLLPQKSQRWNNLLYIWGVFRGKRTLCSGQIPAVSASENLLHSGKLSQSISASSRSSNTQQTLNSNTLRDSKVVASGEIVDVCEIKATSWEQKPPKSQTRSQQVDKVDSSPREEKELKRRPEIDLNCSLQESQEYSADCIEAGGGDDCKRPRSCFSGNNMGNNIIHNDINNNYTCSIAINGKGPSISDEFNRGGVHNKPIVFPELESVGSKHSWKSLQKHVLSNDSSVPSLGLTLGVGMSPADDRNTPPFFTLTGTKDSQHHNSGRETSDTNPSLALSLALPDPKTGGGALKLDSEMKLPKFPEVNTTLSL
ncbi:hypothetical protein PTKIN_Ptkin05aG0012800 [Pterospermum kingtungense]